jgi:hypothetical protein
MTKVNNFLGYLSKSKQIEYQKNNVTTLITILNYDLYQEKETKKETKKKPKVKQKETSKEGKELKEGKEQTIIPTWIDAKAWQDFKTMRIKIKAPLTEEAETRLVAKLGRLKEEGHNVNEILDQSIISSWKGVFPVKEGFGKSTGKPKQMKERIVDGFIAKGEGNGKLLDFTTNGEEPVSAENATIRLLPTT